jgi:AcrR family transcriptional regulator
VTYHHGDLRAALLATAEARIRASGPASVSLRGLARDLGVSHAAPAHHFGTLRGLFTALATEGHRLMGEAMERAQRSGGFAEVGVAYVAFAVDHPAHFGVMFTPDLLELDDPGLAAARAATLGQLGAGARGVAPGGAAGSRAPGGAAGSRAPGGAAGSRAPGGAAGSRAPGAAAAALAAWSLVHGLATLHLSGSLGDPAVRGVVGGAAVQGAGSRPDGGSEVDAAAAREDVLAMARRATAVLFAGSRTGADLEAPDPVPAGR